MKFVNNFITQLTPLLFYSFGGYLVIKGNLTLGALVAALAAHKDLSSPWNELLNYYNQIQESALRWVVVTERFDPPGMIDEALFEGEPAEIPSLAGDLQLEDVTLRSHDGAVILKDITLTLPKGLTVAIADRERGGPPRHRRTADARGAALGRVDPGARATILQRLHQSVIAARIGYASSRPFVAQGSFGAERDGPADGAPATIVADAARMNKL